MPTNILRQRGRALAAGSGASLPLVAGQRIRITIGAVSVRAELLDTPTAQRVWAALPLFSSAETHFTGTVMFETPVESGRERGARQIAGPRDVVFWCEEDRIVIAYGPTPLSRKGEPRLPVPCNIWAQALDDLALLNRTRPGEKVSVTAI